MSGVLHGVAAALPIGPSLNFPFTASDVLPSQITFTRASSATLFDSSGTLVYAPMNLLLQSEDLSTTWGLGDGTVTANSWTAPSGAVTGDIYTIGTNSTFPSQSVTVTSSTTYTLSFYYNKTLTTAAFFRLRFGVDGSSVSAWVNAANNTFGTLNAQLSGGVVTDVGNNIYRVSLQIAYGATDGGSRSVAIAGVTANSGTTADTGNDLAIWGAQLNIANMQGGVTGDLSTYYPTTTAAYQGPRLDYNPATLAARGLLIEEQRTNSIRNNTMQGAVAGTPGTVPTNWVFSVATTTGLTSEVVGTGTESGITYVDLKLSGTAVGAGSLTVAFEPNTQLVASQNQVWTVSMYRRLMAGSFNGLTPTATNIFINSYTAAGTFDANATSTVRSESAPTNAALNTQRAILTGTLASATTARVNAGMFFSIANGAAIDITLRIGLPQLELGAFATSVIPTTTTALTRSADVASVNTLTPWFNANEGTLFAEVNCPIAAANQYFASLDLSALTRMSLHNNAGSGYWFVRDGGVTQAGVTNGTITSGATVKVAGAYAINSFNVSTNGGIGTEDTSGSVPSGLTRLSLGSYTASALNPLNGYLRRVVYYPRRLSNAELQSITS